MVFSWIIDMHHHFIPMISTLSYSSQFVDYLLNDNKKTRYYILTKTRKSIYIKRSSINSQISFFTDQKKKECLQLEN